MAPPSSSSTSWLSSWRQWTVLHVYMFITFLLSGLAVNAVQAALFLLVATWNHRLFRRINYYLVWLIYTQILFLADWWSRSRIALFAPRDFLAHCGKEHALIVMNHHCELDWLYGWMTADRFGVLGNGRVYLKRALRWAPVIGWCWSFSDVIYLDRDWEKDKANIAEGARVHGDYPDPMVILIFAEGTRKTPDKFRASQEFAASKGMEPFKHHLVPRTKGFVHTIKSLDPAKVPAVYDLTVAVNEREGAPASFASLFYGQTTVGDIYVRRVETASLHHKSETEIEEFLIQLYRDKDDLLDNYYRSGGSFTRNGEDERFEDVAAVVPPPRWGSLINVVLLNLLVGLPVTKLFLSMLLSGSPWQMAVSAGVATGLFAVMHKLLDLTKTSKGSSYGAKKKQ